jgi:hypothetical protein
MKMFTKRLSVGLIALALGSAVIGAAGPAMAKGDCGYGSGGYGSTYGYGGSATKKPSAGKVTPPNTPAKGAEAAGGKAAQPQSQPSGDSGQGGTGGQ